MSMAGVTGNALSTDVASFIRNGANEVLIKPLTRAKLIDAIKSYIH